MANFAKLTILFDITSAVPLNTVLSFDTNTTPSNLSETARNIVVTVGQFVRGSDQFDSAQGYYEALIRDYGSDFNIQKESLLSVSIEADDYTTEFSNFSFPDLSVSYIPPVTPDTFEISAVNTAAATLDPNLNAQFIVIPNEFGVAPYVLTTPISSSDGNIGGNYVFETFRYLSSSRTVTLIDSNTDQATFSPMPNVDYFTLDSIDVVESSVGATVSVVITLFAGDVNTVREYSIDNLTWQESPVFTGVVIGSFTMYMRDNYGFSDSLPFEVSGIAPNKPEPEFNIPLANSFRFIPVTQYDCDNVANWDNTLFAELFTEGKFLNVEKRTYEQLISDCDIFNNQIHTNYDNLEVKLYDCEGNEVLEITPELKTENIGLLDKRDCVFGSSDDFKAVIYFTGGNTYDPNTTDINGTYTNIDGGLPSFVSGLFNINLSGGLVLNGDYSEFEEYYDITNRRWGIKLNTTYGGPDMSSICQSTYNSLSYNIWGFDMVGSLIDSEHYYIQVNAQDDDPRYDDISWISEPITNKGVDSTLLIESFNSDNAATIDFTTGYKTSLRIYSRYIKAKNEENPTSFTADNGEQVTQKVIIKRLLTLESDLIPFYLAEKIAIASSFNNISIDKVSYERGESYEVEDLLSERNPFVYVNRDYVSNDVISVGESTGIATQTSQVIGSGVQIAIGDNL